MMYPVWMVAVEAEYVVARLDRAEATRAILLQLAVSSLFSKRGSKVFEKKIKDLCPDE